MKSRLAALLAVGFLGACGGGGGDPGPRICPGANTTPAFTDPDYAPNFVGRYMASGELVLDYVRTPLAGEVTISRTSANKLRFGGGLDPLVGLVEDADHAELVCLTDQQRGSCGTITVNFVDGTATMDSGNLEVYVSIVAEGCGEVLEGYMQVHASPIDLLQGESAEGPAPESLLELVRGTVAAQLAR